MKKTDQCNQTSKSIGQRNLLLILTRNRVIVTVTVTVDKRIEVGSNFLYEIEEEIVPFFPRD
jgi:hypothetical protein